MKPIQEQENDIMIWIESQWKKIDQWKVCAISLANFFYIIDYRKTGQNLSFFNFILNFILF